MCTHAATYQPPALTLSCRVYGAAVMELGGMCNSNRGTRRDASCPLVWSECASVVQPTLMAMWGMYEGCVGVSRSPLNRGAASYNQALYDPNPGLHIAARGERVWACMDSQVGLDLLKIVMITRNSTPTTRSPK